MKYRYTLLLLIAALLASLPASGEKRKKKVDGVTTASSRAEPAKPGRNDVYKIQGTFTGIKSPVICYDKSFYLGGMMYSEPGYERLKDLGIKTIISFLPSPEERAAVKRYGFKLIEIKINQYEGVEKEHIETFKSAIENMPKPFYVHCFSGMPLEAAFAARYRIDYCNWDKERALNEFVRLGGHLVLDQRALKGVLQE